MSGGNNGFAPNLLVPAGAEVVNKFGRNPDISLASDPEDVWGGGGLYPFIASPIALEILSDSSADDKDAGTGARSVDLFMLDAAGLEVTVTLELEGLTPVPLPATYLAINRGACILVGTGGVNAGTLTVRAAGAGATYATIAPDEGQTTMAIYRVPANKRGLLFRHWSTFDRSISAVATMHLMVRMAGESWQNKQAFTVSNSSSWDFLYQGGGIKVEPLTDIRMEVDEVSANSVAVDAGFDLYLVAL